MHHSRSRSLNWKEFFKLAVLKETMNGPHPYFHAELKVPEEFSIEELLMEEFEFLNLPEREKKLFSLSLRKIFLRHAYFKSREFERIADNFLEKISQEKDQLLTFSTQGGGIYLFLALMKHPLALEEKKLICYTSEFPLDIMNLNELDSKHIHFILRPHGRSYLREIPSLWQNSNLIDLFQAHKA